MEKRARYRHRQRRRPPVRRAGPAAGAGPHPAHPRPVLVLDEPLLCAGPQHRGRGVRPFAGLCQGQGGVLISHRLYHFPQLRQVIFMENGKVTVGTHEELMASAPVYRQLYKSQTGGEQS